MLALPCSCRYVLAVRDGAGEECRQWKWCICGRHSRNYRGLARQWSRIGQWWAKEPTWYCWPLHCVVPHAWVRVDMWLPIDVHSQDSQKNNEEIISTYRNHLLNAARVSMVEFWGTYRHKAEYRVLHLGSLSLLQDPCTYLPFLRKPDPVPGLWSHLVDQERLCMNVRRRGVSPSISIPWPIVRTFPVPNTLSQSPSGAT